MRSGADTLVVSPSPVPPPPTPIGKTAQDVSCAAVPRGCCEEQREDDERKKPRSSQQITSTAHSALHCTTHTFCAKQLA